MFSYFDIVKTEKDAMVISQTRQNIYENYFVTELAQIVELDNFPEDLDQQLSKLILIKDGLVALYKENDEYFICRVTPIGYPRKDGRPNRCIIKYIGHGENGEYELKTKEVVNDKDIVIWYNTSYAVPELNVNRVSHVLSESDKSIDALVRYSRIMPLLRVKDSVEKEKLEQAIKQADVDLGLPQTYISDDVFNDLFSNSGNTEPVLNIHNVDDSVYIQYLSHLKIDTINQFHSMWGLSSVVTSKQAQQSVAEVSAGDGASFLLPLDMLKQAKEFCERCKKYFGLEMDAHFGIVHEMNYNKFVGACSMETDPHEDVCNDKEKGENENENSFGNMETETDPDTDPATIS